MDSGLDSRPSRSLEGKLMGLPEESQHFNEALSHTDVGRECYGFLLWFLLWLWTISGCVFGKIIPTGVGIPPTSKVCLDSILGGVVRRFYGRK